MAGFRMCYRCCNLKPRLVRQVILGKNAFNDSSFEWSVRKLIDCRFLGFTDSAQAVNYLTSHDVGGLGNERFYNYLINKGIYDTEPRIKLAFVCLLTAVGIPMILAEDESGNAYGLVVFADSSQQSTIIKEATVENLKRIEQLSDLITQFQRLFGECVDAGKYLSEQTGELKANNEILLQQFSEFVPPQRIEEQYSGEIVTQTLTGTITNESPKDKNPWTTVTNESPDELSDPEALEVAVML